MKELKTKAQKEKEKKKLGENKQKGENSLFPLELLEEFFNNVVVKKTLSPLRYSRKAAFLSPPLPLFPDFETYFGTVFFVVKTRVENKSQNSIIDKMETFIFCCE